jgi:hypothetical protein
VNGQKRRPGSHKHGGGESQSRIGPHRGSCVSGKVSYQTRADANRAVMLQAASSGFHRAYRCGSCRDWHLTSARECERPPLAFRPDRPRPTS